MTIHYVDSAAADDSGDGHTPETAFKTIAAAITAAGTGDQSDDSILLKCGGTWREMATIGCYGTSGHPFTFASYGTGDKPKIYGSTQVASWTNESGSLWYATCTTDPYSVWFVTLAGIPRWGERQSAKGNLANEYDWWWDDPNDRLYVYATANPATAYTTVEKAGLRRRSIYAETKPWLVIDGIECAFCWAEANGNAEGIEIWECSDTIIRNCYTHHIGKLEGSDNSQGNGIYSGLSSRVLIQNNQSDCNARRGICISAQYNTAADDCIIEHNILLNNRHAGIDIFGNSSAGSTVDGTIIRYNYMDHDSEYAYGYPTYDTTHGILLEGDSSGTYPDGYVTNTQIYYNIVANEVNVSAIGVYQRTRYTAIYNNVCYGAYTGSTNGFGISIDTADTMYNTQVTIKNNIAMNFLDTCFEAKDKDAIVACDNNCWYSTVGSGTYTRVETTEYHSDDFAAYKTATGWDTNGLWVNPLFVSAAAGDFRLQAASPCRDAGVDVGLTSDYAGRAVPQALAPCIGAHEFPVIWFRHAVV